jgi:hypothetical protein
MSFLLFDLAELYRQTFGGRPYQVLNSQETPEDVPFRIEGRAEDISQLSGSQLKTEYLGKEIWLPVKFVGLNAGEFGASELLLPYATVKITGKKTIVKTPLAERKGTVKEVFNIDDYIINIKGFVIDDAKRTWPEKEISILKKLYELNEAVQLDNALTNIFLDKDTRVSIESIEWPEVEGGRKHIRPFSMTMESDSIFELEV